jgi:hypothetical protein
MILTVHTQNVGNTRILSEQNNWQMKMPIRCLNSVIPVLLLDLVSIIFRFAFLFQNFRVGFVIGNQKEGGEGRPSRAAVRWLGATDEGLIDVRGLHHLWAEIGALQTRSPHKEFPKFPAPYQRHLNLRAHTQLISKQLLFVVSAPVYWHARTCDGGGGWGALSFLVYFLFFRRTREKAFGALWWPLNATKKRG